MVLLCFFGLVLEGFELIVDLEDEVLDAGQVLFCRLQFVTGFFLPGLIDRDAGSLLQHFSTTVVFVLDQVIDHVQGDDGVTVGTDTGIQKQILNVFQPALHIVEPIFTFPALVEATGDGNSIEFRRQQVARVLESETDLCQSAGTTGLGSVKNQAFQVLGPELADLLLPDHPADTVHDIGFSTTVGPYNAGHVLVELNHRFVREALEPLDL